MNEDGKGEMLHNAVREGNAFEVERILTIDETDINYVSLDSENETALHVAMHQGRFDIVKLLLDHKADVNATDNSGRTPLHLAILYQSYNVIMLLLDNNANINKVDDFDVSPLFIACFCGEFGIAQLMLEKAGNQEITEKDWKELEDGAQYQGNWDIVKYIQKCQLRCQAYWWLKSSVCENVVVRKRKCKLDRKTNREKMENKNRSINKKQSKNKKRKRLERNE